MVRTSPNLQGPIAGIASLDGFVLSASHGGRLAKRAPYPVIRADGRLAGLISRGDVLRWMRDGASGDQVLGEVALEVATAFADETAGQLADRMAQGRFSRVPVIGREDRKLIGIVTRHELLRVRTLALQAEQARQGPVKLPG